MKHIWSHTGYSRDYLKLCFVSLGSLVSILQGFDERHGGCGSDFFGPLMKIEVHCTLIREIKLLETSLAQGKYSWDYFNADFMSLEQ